MPQYTSPLRPLDIGFVARVCRVEVDWDLTDTGPFDPATLATRRYGFAEALPPEVVDQMSLVLVS